MKEQRRIILVTGSHRSGTTWVGKVLASAPRTYYLQEPFNPNNSSSKLPMKMTYWFQRLTCDEGSAEKDAFRRMFELNVSWPSGNLKDPHYLATLPKSTAIAIREKLHVWRTKFIVMKDPIALLSADWLSRNFSVLPIVMIRHPAAFVASIKLRGWFFDFSNLLSQPEAIDIFCPEERENLERADRSQGRDILVDGAVLWRILHKVILRYQAIHPNWLFCRHEDLSCDPTQQFSRIFQTAGIPFTYRTQRFLDASTTTSSTRKYITKIAPSNITRNSRENVFAWKQKLNSTEINLVRDLVGATGARFYSELEW